MNYFRNPEIKKESILWACMMAVLATGSYITVGSLAALTAVIACLFCYLMHMISGYYRYKSISDLSQEIDHILYDSSRFDLSRFAEGELAVLQSEVYKMTIRLREQADALRKDKNYLADSLADISHQIRTPLTALHLIVQLMGDKDTDPQRKRELLREMHMLLGRIDWLIEMLLKISRMDAGTLAFESQKIRVKELVKRAYEPVSVSMDIQNQTFHLECEEDATFTGDMERTGEALGNILKNCMEHTPEGGTISVKAYENAIFTEIIVEDTGPGIHAEDLENIFKRFYKGKNSKESSIGIGLAYARMIVNAQNGTIKAENRMEGGSRFILRFYKNII